MKCSVCNRGACLSSVFNLKDKFKRAGRPASFFFSTSFFHGKETPGPGVRCNGRRAPAARLITARHNGESCPGCKAHHDRIRRNPGHAGFEPDNRNDEGIAEYSASEQTEDGKTAQPSRRDTETVPPQRAGKKEPECPERSRNAPKGPGGRGPGARRGAVKTVGIERWERFSGMPADRTTDTRGSDRTTEIRRIRGDIRSESAEDRKIRNIQGVETPKARKREGPTTNTTVRGDIPVGTRRRVNEKEEQNISKL